MTDTYAEELLIEKFLELPSLQNSLRAASYYKENKEDERVLLIMETLIPYFAESGITVPEETDENREIFEINVFCFWYSNYLKDTPEHNNIVDNDEVYDEISLVDLTTINKYGNNGSINQDLFPMIAFPNQKFERPFDGYWYELNFIPAQPMQMELGTNGRLRWVGILQVNVCTPKNDGTKAVNDRYDEIASMFRQGLIIEGVRISKVYRTSAVDDGDYYCMFVSINWQADLDR